jgi:predicted dehydrogenase
MLRVAIVGCGKIADSHASQIQRVKGCEIVAVCDREPLMAKQLFERFPIKRWYDDLGRLLDEAKPDVVHITTPPQGHYAIARQCLDAGANVYVEKPFTLYAHEAESLIAHANRRGLKITAGHDDQFSHAARRMRELVARGYLGGTPVHMESYYCYDLSQASYARALLADKQHWVRKLPGKLLQNIISHGIARIAEFIETDTPRVIAHGFVSPLLKRMDEHDIIDELRVIVTDDQRTTAYFTFSSQMRPSLHHFRLFGPKNGIVIDHDQDGLVKIRGTRIKSYGEKFIPHLDVAKQGLGNFTTNLKLFLARDFHMKSGMKYLIETFYRSIQEGTPVPIPYREIVLTAKIMDAIFEQLEGTKKAAVPFESPERIARELKGVAS